MRIFTIYTALVALLAFTGSCKIDHVRPIENNVLVLPAKGIPYTVTSISGVGFDTIKANNVVKFNNVQALVNSATANQLFVTVPLNATTGKVTVTVKGLTKTSLVDFRVLKPVKVDVEKQTLDYNLSELAFSLTGNTYGLNSFYYDGKGTLAETIVQIVNNKKTVFYTAVDSTVTVGYPQLKGLAVDSKGNVYAGQTVTYSDEQLYLHDIKSEIIKITAQGKASVFAGNFSSISEMAIDAFDNIYVIDSGIVKKVNYKGEVSRFTNERANHITTDKIGNVYINDQKTLSKYNAAGVKKSSLALNISFPYAFSGSMIIDGSGNIVVITSNGLKDPQLNVFNQSGFASYSFSSALPGRITRLAVDRFGDVYVINSTISLISVHGSEPIGDITHYSFQ